jgi:predicted nucleic-acid-binding protein
MNAIDTNILIRYLTQDDAKQGEAARQLIEIDGPVFLSHIVFIEAAWVLTTSYNLNRNTIAEALSDIASSGFFILEKPQIIRKALHDYQNGFDFADMLIGYRGKDSGCNTTYTFDKKAGKHLIFTLLDCLD